MNDTAVKRVIIAGGGTAGWMAAASLSALIGKRLDISLVESDDIPTVGVGEATIPTILTMHRLLKIPEPEFLKAVQGTFKLGIEFENWRRKDHKYIHSFGITGESCWTAGFHHFWSRACQEGIAGEYGDYCTELRAAEQNKFAVTSNPRMNYAYHIDSGLYGQYLRKLAEAKGVSRIEGKIAKVNLNNEQGHIESLQLESGKVIEGDLFLDCTGFRALLLGDALGVGYDDWSDCLPNDSAFAVQTEAVRAPIPYTRSIALDAGWRWQIPLQHRVGNGHVFSSRFKDTEEARDDLLNAIEGRTLIEPRLIKFTTGQRKTYWHKNCVSIGLSSGFIEPLESTSIHLIQQGITWLIKLFPDQIDAEKLRTQFNQQFTKEAETIRDFIVLHYKLTEREDTEYWRYLKHMPVSERLESRLELFKKTGTVIEEADDLFAENSWVQVMMGQGILPESYHPIVDMMSKQELTGFMQNQRNKVQHMLSQLPSHQQFIQLYMKQVK